MHFRATIFLSILQTIFPLSAYGATAGEIYQATGVAGGVVVHVGCGDGTLTASLRINESYLIHGLDVVSENVAKARTNILDRGLYGPVSVDVFDGRTLPYADDLVNLVVADKLGDVSMDEVTRVLAPGGVAYVGGVKTVKPRPSDIDEWTHHLHDASNNCVAADRQVGPPRGLRWVCEPLWARSHEFASSLCAMVSSGGRLFYIFDEGLTGVTDVLPERWTLIARDAFNGVLLWKRPMEKWGTAEWRNKGLRNTPGTISRRIVAQGDRLFVTLGYDAPVSVLDGATGKVLRTYEETKDADELRCVGDLLLFRRAKGPLVAIDIASGRKLWETAEKPQALTPAVCGDRAFFVAGKAVYAVGLKDGKEIWKTPYALRASLLLAGGRCVLISGGNNQLKAFSAETGKPLWDAKLNGHQDEVFVAGGLAWHWDEKALAGRDLDSGAVKARVNPDEMFTSGHHPRCYQSKATEKYLITPNRGAEFLSLTGDKNVQNDWTRGPCAYGILPCNGLLYVPPNPCFCYPGVKVTGFNAYAPTLAPEDPASAPRLQRGPAYGQADKVGAVGAVDAGDWPTYRHDERRSGATSGEAPSDPAPAWNVALRGPLTPPVASGGRVYVAARDQHTLYALDAGSGKTLWSFTAGGRIDSPPTLHAGTAVFGCADGQVYCLRASDGVLAWRFRAAPSRRLIAAFNQLESPWRVHGSVLVLDSPDGSDAAVYFTAGRSTYLDGGISLFALNPSTGEVLHERCLDTYSPIRKDTEGKPFIPGYHIEGAKSDILVSQDGFLYLGQMKFDRALATQPTPYILTEKTAAPAMDLVGKPFVGQDAAKTQGYEKHQRDWVERTQKELVAEYRRKYGGFDFGNRLMGPHVLATGGFLDDSWFNRTYWMYASVWPGYYIAHAAAKTGQLLVVGPERTFAVQAFPNRNLQSPQFVPGTTGYLLFADGNENEPVLADSTRETTKGWGFTRAAPPVWHEWVPVRVRGMVLAGERLFVAGAPDTVKPGDAMAAFEGRAGAVLRVYSADGGKMLKEISLAAPPVFDGLIAADGKLLMCTTDGRVLCFGAGP